MKTTNRLIRKPQLSAALGAVLAMQSGLLGAADVGRFLAPAAWQCTVHAEMNHEVRKASGPGGMAHDPKRQLFQALENTGTRVEAPGGNTDSYYEAIKHSVTGKVRLHSTYDGGPDGIQIAGWQNGGADVQLEHYFEGTEQNGAITRDRTAAFDGFAKFEGDEYEPSFQIWIYPDENIYSLEYALAPVTARQTEHCRMKEGMEEGRKKLESATDADMPLGNLMSGLAKFTCASESTKEVELDGGALSGLVENVPIPETGIILQGEENSHFVDSPGVVVSWSCQPE